jgi:hypothetical protein
VNRKQHFVCIDAEATVDDWQNVKRNIVVRSEQIKQLIECWHIFSPAEFLQIQQGHVIPQKSDF